MLSGWWVDSAGPPQVRPAASQSQSQSPADRCCGKKCSFRLAALSHLPFACSERGSFFFCTPACLFASELVKTIFALAGWQHPLNPLTKPSRRPLNHMQNVAISFSFSFSCCPRCVLPLICTHLQLPSSAKYNKK